MDSNIIFRGDFGLSFEWQTTRGRPDLGTHGSDAGVDVFHIVGDLGIALPIGVFSAVKKYSIGDYVVTFLSFLGLAVP